MTNLATLENFEAIEVQADETNIFLRRFGSGPAVLLLHGFPQTHLMWRSVAPLLARRFTVVCADLRGYGNSGCPASGAHHAPYAKRAMANDMVSVMGKIGFPRFSVAGHDRGGRVAYRLALDHPERVEHLAVLDILPTADTWERADKKFATAFWPWSLLAQPEPLPERLVQPLLIVWSMTRLAAGELLQMHLAPRRGRRISKRCAIPLMSTQYAKSTERRQPSTMSMIWRIAKLGGASPCRFLCSGVAEVR
jgi:pimeloyl-ACP methyl ester carboxylesterase